MRPRRLSQMAKFRVGSVPYVNATPLVWWFLAQGDRSPVEVLFDVPSRLPAMLESGAVDAVLVSSVDALRTPGRRVATGACIASDGPVESVRMFSRVPFGLVQTLALDESSMTSNLLAQVVLREAYGTRPVTIALPPQIGLMLDVCEAAVLIGDIGMTAQYPGARVLDLGAAWSDGTGLPFVWALWTGGDRLTPELAGLLEESRRQGAVDGPNWPAVLDLASERADWGRETIDRYLRSCVSFECGERERAGLARYRDSLLAEGLLERAESPEWVGAAATGGV